MSTVQPGGGQPAGAPGVAPADATVLRMMLGHGLRRLREAAGVAPGDGGYEIRAPRSKISRLEHGLHRLFQADACARAVTLLGHGAATAGGIGRRVSLRLKHQDLLAWPGPGSAT